MNIITLASLLITPPSVDKTYWEREVYPGLLQ